MAMTAMTMEGAKGSGRCNSNRWCNGGGGYGLRDSSSSERHVSNATVMVAINNATGTRLQLKGNNNNQLAMGAQRRTMATKSMAMDTVQQQQRWMVQWQGNGNNYGRHDGNVMVIEDAMVMRR